MRFNMHPIPEQPSEESKILWAWALVYFFLAVAFLILAGVLWLAGNDLGFLAIFGCWLSLSFCRRRTREAELYDRFDNEG